MGGYTQIASSSITLARENCGFLPLDHRPLSSGAMQAVAPSKLYTTEEEQSIKKRLCLSTFMIDLELQDGAMTCKLSFHAKPLHVPVGTKYYRNFLRRPEINYSSVIVYEALEEAAYGAPRMHHFGIDYSG
ncbi:hypothetical protein BC939DRAFT_529887 [Gamsiella multidivaricata]|uniref:uncharacterized protein n=1 Tax=Gamsiella multidivaricata TaxID=101098 RepID=UPI00221F0DFC|nr:uncharacterized protein BC939DRAFT_529887 [Gamsiella multidivaricata]KAI7821699.1 hypothetical protein BC939DRAFT_529887 [Gamsiella multidivaricata]